jgi:ribosomal protein L37AE/L43A
LLEDAGPPHASAGPRAGGRLRRSVDASELDRLDWFSFVCVACGQETYVAREAVQAVTEFATMCSWLFGDPPVCSFCREL